MESVAEATEDSKHSLAGRMRKIVFSLKKAPLVPLAIIGIFVFTAIFANFLTPHSPVDPSLEHRLRPPFFLEGGSLTYPLGTDLLGRDILARIIYGTRASLTVSLMTIFFAGFFGISIGLISGYKGGWLDAVLMRIVDATVSFPTILFAIVLLVVIGAGLWNVVLAIAMLQWARYARVIRGEVLSLKERDFIAQARIAGCSTFRIMMVHLFPNVLNILVVMVTIEIGRIILVEASLSFLGAGIPPPTPAWGQMVASGRDYITSAWWVSLWPGLAIMCVVLSFNLLGDWLRDTLDPKLRQV
jgi:peptide/nickel transport system permease protein